MEKKRIPHPQGDFMSRRTKTTPNPYDDIARFEHGKFQFNFSESKSWLEKQGKKMFGKHFRIYEEDNALILSLLVYAIGDRESAENKQLNLSKGILLTGPIGCGKTSLMTLVNFFLPTEKQYALKSAREISFEFEAEGFRVITRYGKTGDYCFDDLGIEQVQKHFGNECNVMADVILSRYESFVSKGILTYATTNLSASELESLYGNRVRSRMREMFNLVAFDKNAKDKRT